MPPPDWMQQQQQQLLTKLLAMIMCAWCPSTRPGQDVLPAEHNKRPGGKYLPHCNKKVCTDTARGVPRPDRPRRERSQPKCRAIHEDAGSVLSELASAALEEWSQDPAQAVDALIALQVIPPTWTGLPPELAVHVLINLPLADIRAMSVVSKEDSRRASVAWSRRCTRGWVSSLFQGDYDHLTEPLTKLSSITTHAGLLAIASGTTVLLDAQPSGLMKSLGLSWTTQDGKILVGRPSGPLDIYQYPSGRSERWPRGAFSHAGLGLEPNRELHCSSIALSETRVAIKLMPASIWGTGPEGGYLVWCVTHTSMLPRGSHAPDQHTHTLPQPKNCMP
jgi:hypothetical protein